MSEATAPAFTFTEAKGLTRVTAGREESAETKALRVSLSQGIALSDAAKDSDGFGKPIEFKMAKGSVLTKPRTINRTNKKTGVTTTVQTQGGEDASLVRVLRLIRTEADSAGRGLSVAVSEANKSTWLVRFQTRNRKARKATTAAA